MSNFSKFLSLQNGVARTIDIAASGNTFEVSNFQIKGATSGYVLLQAAATTTAYTLTLPSAQASSPGMVLVNNGSGALSWGSGAAATALDGTFVIQNTSDNTKQLAFNASAIATGTTRTISMPNANVDLGALTNSNISASAAIAYSKLALSNSIVDADISSSAAIALNKLASVTVNRALISDGSGYVSASSVTATELGYLSGVTSAIQTQINSKVSSSLLGANNGVATLDGSGKIPSSQLTVSAMEYKGTWAASTNTPTLANGTGNTGDVYVASDSGTVDFGAGNIIFAAGDWVVYNGSIWEKSINSNAVVSVNSSVGAVTVNAINQLTGDVTTSAASGSQSKAATVVSVGGSLAADVHTAELAANAATAANTVSTIVKRDSSGNFAAGTITASLTGHASLDLAAANNLSDVASAATAFANISPLTTAGDLIFENSSPAPARLPIGTAGQVLTVSGGLPSWAAPSVSPSAITLTQHHILVGNASNLAADVAMSGDVTIVSSGATTIGAGKVTASMLATVTDGITLDQLGAGSTLEVKTGGINNAQIGASAAIAYSKLALTGSIVNADVNASAAIAYSKLALSASIVNADIAAAAAIDFSKLAALTTGQLIVGNGGTAVAATMSGDATISATGALTIASNAVTNAKAAQMAANTIKGNNTGSTANASDLTVAQVNSMLGDILANGSVTYSANQPMGGFKLTGLSAGSVNGDSVRYEQLVLKADDNIVIKKDGSVTYTAAQSMGGFKLTNLAAATSGSDALRKDQAMLLDGSQSMTAAMNMGANKITNMADPTLAQDSATKSYVDNAVAGLSWKQAVHVASVADVTISSAPAAIDGHTLNSLERILLKDQATASENGIYVFNGTGNALTRSSDADTWNEIVGLVVYVEQGTANAGSKYVNTNVVGGTLGTTAVTFTIFSAASSLDGSGTAGYNAYWTASHTLSSEQYVGAIRGGLATDASAFTGVVKAAAGVFSASTIVNADVNASAAIAYSKLALSNSIVNADVNSAAAIAYTKLALSASIVNADISGSAAIAYSKLALSASIVDADIAAGAAIAYSKLSLNNSITNADLAGSIADSKLNTITTANKVSGSAIQLTAASGLQDNTGLELKLDGSTLSKSASGVKVAVGGITNTEVSASAAIAYSKLALSNSIVAGDLTAASVTAAKLNSDTFDQVTITGGTGSAAVVQSAPLSKKTFVAGEAFAAATSFLVRMAMSGETAGRVYKADYDTTSSDKFWAFGIAQSTAGVSAGGNIDVVMLGSQALGGSDTAFGSGDIGKPVFLTAAGAFSITAPSAALQAVFKIGTVQSTSSILVEGHLVAIN